MSKDQPTRVSRLASACGYFCLPYLLVAGFTLGILAGDPLSIPPLSALAETLGYVLVGIFILHVAMFALVRATPARELIVCVIVAYLCLYGYVQLRMQHVLPGLQFLAMWSTAFGAAIWLVGRWKDAALLRQVASFVGFASLALVGMQAYQIGGAHYHDQQRLATLAHGFTTSDSINAVTTREDLPDVYYIVLDAYGRDDVLAELYQHDNAEFLNALRVRGFYVAEQSRSNYHLTELSLASSLNMSLLDSNALQDFQTRVPLREMIQHSAVADTLQRQGYTTVAFASGKEDTECREFDRYLDPSPALSIYQDVLLHTTAIPSLIDLTPPNVPRPADWHRRRIVETLKQIPQARENAQQPVFVFAHLMSPHPPFVFEEDGEHVDWHGQYLVADGPAFLSCHAGDQRLYRDAYASQLKHLNEQLIAMVDRIVEKAPRDAVIILQGDHGPRSEMNFEDHDGANLPEAMGILTAVRMPHEYDGEFYAGMTPVNTFRLVLGELFDQPVALQPDRSYFETAPYHFVDITEAASGRPLAVPATEGGQRIYRRSPHASVTPVK